MQVRYQLRQRPFPTDPTTSGNPGGPTGWAPPSRKTGCADRAGGTYDGEP